MNALLEHLQENVINQDEERWNVYHRTGTRRQSVHVNLTQESQTMKTFAEKYALILLKNMHWDQGMQGDQNFFESFYFIVHRLALAVAKAHADPPHSLISDQLEIDCHVQYREGRIRSR